MRKLETVNAIVIEGRNLPVLAWRQPRKPSLAGVHDECRYARLLERAGQRFQRLLRVLLIDAQTAFDGDRHLGLGAHGGDAIGHQERLRHEASAEAALLHPVGGAADVEIDLVIAEIGGNPRALRQLRADRDPPS